MTDEADRLYERLLVLRCQGGDAAAFAELVGRYAPRLRYFVRKMLDADPDDVLQDVWLDVFRGVGRLLDAGAFPAWVYRVARDRTCRVLRRQRRDAVPLGDLEPADDPAEREFTAEEAGRIHKALGELTPDHREVLLLRFLEDMAYDDIAQVIGCPVGTVRSRLHHAKRALRVILEKGHQT
jgi:RNA polymerase sigma-70 factor (ECF subfamily)